MHENNGLSSLTFAKEAVGLGCDYLPWRVQVGTCDQAVLCGYLLSVTDIVRPAMWPSWACQLCSVVPSYLVYFPGEESPFPGKCQHAPDPLFLSRSEQHPLCLSLTVLSHPRESYPLAHKNVLALYFGCCQNYSNFKTVASVLRSSLAFLNCHHKQCCRIKVPGKPSPPLGLKCGVSFQKQSFWLEGMQYIFERVHFFSVWPPEGDFFFYFLTLN